MSKPGSNAVPAPHEGGPYVVIEHSSDEWRDVAIRNHDYAVEKEIEAAKWREVAMRLKRACRREHFNWGPGCLALAEPWETKQ